MWYQWTLVCNRDISNCLKRRLVIEPSLNLEIWRAHLQTPQKFMPLCPLASMLCCWCYTFWPTENTEYKENDWWEIKRGEDDASGWWWIWNGLVNSISIMLKLFQFPKHFIDNFVSHKMSAKDCSKQGILTDWVLGR